MKDEKATGRLNRCQTVSRVKRKRPRQFVSVAGQCFSLLSSVVKSARLTLNILTMSVIPSVLCEFGVLPLFRVGLRSRLSLDVLISAAKSKFRRHSDYGVLFFDPLE